MHTTHILCSLLRILCVCQFPCFQLVFVFCFLLVLFPFYYYYFLTVCCCVLIIFDFFGAHLSKCVDRHEFVWCDRGFLFFILKLFLVQFLLRSTNGIISEVLFALELHTSHRIEFSNQIVLVDFGVSHQLVVGFQFIYSRYSQFFFIYFRSFSVDCESVGVYFVIVIDLWTHSWFCNRILRLHFDDYHQQTVRKKKQRTTKSHVHSVHNTKFIHIN